MTKKAILAAGGILAVIIAGCISCELCFWKKINWQTAEPGTILVDYYESTRATVGGDKHLEYVLRMTEEKDTVALEVYRRREDEEETCEHYEVPLEVVEQSFAIIDSKKLRSWNDKYNSGGLGGGVVVCRFFDGEKQIRVSTDRMPEDGHHILMSIGQAIAPYQKEEYRVIVDEE